MSKQRALKPTDDDGPALDLNQIGLDPPNASDGATELLEKEVPLKFVFGNKSWDLIVSAIDGQRRSRIQRKRVVLADNIPFGQLAEDDQFRATCLATVSACIDVLPKDLQGYILAHDIVLFRLYEEVMAHNHAYFLAIFGEGAGSEGPADE